MEFTDRSNEKIILSWCREVEGKAWMQACDTANHPIVDSPVALMPDAHMGYGVPIGCVFGSYQGVIPNAVGVDIGCGMRAMNTGIDVNKLSTADLIEITSEVRKRVPVGFKWRDKPLSSNLWHEAPTHTEIVAQQLERARLQLGTLGGGNHFIELQADENDTLWIMIHTGSRNLGKQIADYYHQTAVQLNRKWCSAIPNEDLAFLPAGERAFDEYLQAMNFALEFARENRAKILNDVVNSFIVQTNKHIKAEFFIIDVHHNYANAESIYKDDESIIVHRKGATAAWEDDLGIIPGSMGSKSYIVRGKGNKSSLKSCSHGAGRQMGRGEANRNLSVEEADAAMEGIVHSGWSTDKKGKPKLEEAPQAYKNISKVMEQQQDLVEIVKELRPIAVVKG